MTFGQLKFRLTKAFAGVDADLIEGWITDCYQEILGMLPWKRLDVQAILITTAPYSTGTVNVANGSANVTLTGGTWTTGMTGRAFRIPGDVAEYEFTYASGTTGTLDRNYAGTTAAAASYSIYQSIYPLPADCRFLDESAFESFELGPIRKLATEEAQSTLLASATCSTATVYSGVPTAWWPYMDNTSSPPQMQVRFDPIPDKVYGIPFTYCAEASNPSGTSFTLLPWIQTAALIEGTTAKIKRHLKDYAGAQLAMTALKDAMAVMMSEEAYRRGPLQMQMGSYYTSHRARRGR